MEAPLEENAAHKRQWKPAKLLRGSVSEAAEELRAQRALQGTFVFLDLSFFLFNFFLELLTKHTLLPG